MAVCKPFVKLDYNILQANIDATEFDIAEFDLSFVGRFKASDLSENLVTLKKIFTHPSFDINEYPYLASKVQYVPMSSEELAQFQTEFGYTSERVKFIFEQYQTPTAMTVLTTDGVRFMSDLEDFYSQNVAAAASGGFCSTIGGIFSAISELSSLVSKAKGALGAVTDFLNGDLSQIIGKINLKIQLVIASVTKAIDAIVRQITSKLSNAFDMVANLPQNINKGLSSAIASAKSLLSGGAVDILKKNIEVLAGRFTAQFPQPLSLENVQLIVFRFCQILESVNSVLMNPVDAIIKRVNDAKTVRMYAQSSSNQNLAGVKALGVSIPSWDQRVASLANTAKQANAAGQRPAGGGGVFIPDASYIKLDITDEENSWHQNYNGLTAFEDRDLVIRPQVASMGYRSYQHYQSKRGINWESSQNYFSGESKTIEGFKCFEGDAGIMGAHPELLVALRRVAKRLGHKLTITSAFRSYYYQTHFVGGEKASNFGSPHSKGCAFDVLFPNGGDDATMAKLVEYASREGFTRIAAYTEKENRFFHLDTLPRKENPWTRMSPDDPKHRSIPLGTLTKQAMTQHLNEGFTNSSVSAATIKTNLTSAI